MTSTPFFIPDTSPIFTYSAGWLPAYHAKGDGFDETFHQTSSGSDIISLNLTASAFHLSTPHSNTAGDKCDVQYRLNGSDWADGCDVKGLPKGWHVVDIRPKESGGMQFLGVRGELDLRSNGKHHNTTIDNLSPQFSYSAAPASWTLLNSAGPIGEVQNQTAATTFGDKGAFFGQSLALSTAAGAKAELKFTGEAVYLYGIGGPEMGMGELVLDGRKMPPVNMTLPWRSYSSLLFMAGDLDGTVEHTLSLTNTVAGRTAVIDYAIVTVAGDAKPSPNLGLILSAAAGGVTAVLLLCVFLYFLITRRRSARRHRATTASTSRSGPAHSTATYSDGPKSIDEWRKHSGGSGSPISPVSIVFSEGSKSTTHLVQQNRASPPLYDGSEYPDYIPYNGPIEPRPTMPAAGTANGRGTPPNIAAGSASAASWLNARANSVSSRTPSPGSGTGRPNPDSASDWARSVISPYSATSASTPTPTSSRFALTHPSQPTRTGSRETISTLDVPLTASDYYSRRDQGRSHTGSPSDLRMSATDLFSLPSATPTRRWNVRDSVAPSSAGSEVASLQNATIGTATTGRLEGSQSVTRVLPNRPGFLSTLSTIDDNTPLSHDGTSMSRGAPSAFHHGQAMQPRHLVGRAPPHLAHITSTGGFSTLYAAYGGTSPQSSSAGPNPAQSGSTGRRTPSAIPSSAALPSSSSTSPTLRRGPSIKSVKTARSFFSGLLPSADAPAVPGQYTPRPDSDLFGESVSVAGRPSVSGVPSYVQPRPRGGQGGAVGLGAGLGGGGRLAPHPLRLIEEDGGRGPKNMFIELDPNSPMTVVSRPGSEQPIWR